MRKNLVLTASGRDRSGILEEFTRLLLHYDGNVEASRMVRLGGDFAMLMFVSLPEERIDELRGAMKEIHYAKYDVVTRVSEPAEAEVPGGQQACGITVTGADHMGIIHQIARYLSEQGINVESMSTEVVAAPMSGTPLFTMSAVVLIPPKLSVNDLREALEYIGEEVSVSTRVISHEE